MFRHYRYVLVLVALGAGFAVAWFADSQRRDDVLSRLEVERMRVSLLERLPAKGHVVEELLAGRLGLLEAAAQFRNIDRSMPPGFWSYYHRSRPDDGDAEGYCRQVIRHVEVVAEDRGQWEQVDRLEAELCKHLERGSLQLPETPPLRNVIAPARSVDEE